MLEGLRTLLERTRGLSPVARAALISFGFIYLHPMIDGNGRISRFLINDVLRRDGALPAPYIVPISAVLQRPNLRPLSYALELTIDQEMRAEAQYLQQHTAARERLKTIIEGPDPVLDRIIRSVRQSRECSLESFGPSTLCWNAPKLQTTSCVQFARSFRGWAPPIRSKMPPTILPDISIELKRRGRDCACVPPTPPTRPAVN